MTILTFYPRGEPAVCYLFEALARHAPVRNFWPAKLRDMVHLATGRATPDPNRTTPLWLHLKSLASYGEKIARGVVPGDTVIFTRPDQGELFSFFPQQRKVFYVLDDYRNYNRDWGHLDNALLKSCDRVIAISPALGELLETRMPGLASRLSISGNGVPASWIPSSCPLRPAEIPGFQKGAKLVGVIGNISSRLRLEWLCHAVEQTPSLNWLFVGGVEEAELLPEDKPFIRKLDRHPRCYFTGRMPYEALLPYVRALDVALMPYSERSTNPCGSAMRLFFHLPFGQPIIATKGCKMVEDFVPLVAMADGPDELAALLNSSTSDGGLREVRWRESFRHTWDARADALRDVLIG